MTKLKIILTTLFVAVIIVSLPLKIITTDKDQVIKSENRKVVPFPTIHKVKKREIIDFIETLDKYVEDRLPFKEYVFFNFGPYYKRNTNSVDYSNAIEGSNDWLFLGNNYNNVINQHIHDQTLDETTRKGFNKRIQEMSRAYPTAFTTVLVCPDKLGIYWENIPKYLRGKVEFRFADKKIKNLKENNINVIDLYAALKEAKKIDTVYYKTDTHWNPKGAEAGFREFYKQLSKKISLKKLDYDLYEYGKKDGFQGDLTHIGGFFWLKETVPVFKPKYKVDWVYNGKEISDYTHLSPELAIPTNSHFMTNVNAPNKQRVFWCGDSFSSALAPFITLSFENIRYLSNAQCTLSNPKFLTEISNFKPNLIVYETVERDL